mmetsp:Transcript_82626/g.210185  ORF Transcript_82626/g.210185 Transcript_82626/m.210185 type:complete len:228 (+) Transcript_82626:133-816(+)
MSGGLYAVLGVSRSATRASIRESYLRLAKQLHPDVNKTSEASIKFQRVREAYEVLSDETRRREHDRIIFGGGGGGGGPTAGGSASSGEPGAAGSAPGFGAAGAAGFGPGSQSYWHDYQRARQQQHPGGRGLGPDLRWQKQQHEDEFRQRYREHFDREKYSRNMALTFMRVMPFLAPVWLVILYLSLRRTSRSPALEQGTMVTYDGAGRAYMQDAYGRSHRLPDFDRQ